MVGGTGTGVGRKEWTANHLNPLERIAIGGLITILPAPAYLITNLASSLFLNRLKYLETTKKRWEAISLQGYGLAFNNENWYEKGEKIFGEFLGGK